MLSPENLASPQSKIQSLANREPIQNHSRQAQSPLVLKGLSRAQRARKVLKARRRVDQSLAAKAAASPAMERKLRKVEVERQAVELVVTQEPLKRAIRMTPRKQPIWCWTTSSVNVNNPTPSC